MKTLNNLKPGEIGIVDHITAEGAVKRHFLDMGITKGVPVMMERIAPFGDPVAVRLRGYSLSLRREEAKKIVLEQGTHEK
ncbi:FeoA family protein [Butyricicoccus sp. Marseille-Q5471]|uniref:FeoA family protein n=1 Tax=Butyricicoccus sp. Marseille-Q5471 TaxID=3039493 RepID=UPI0024BCA107|nr:FeoA family protein [Butyricicoccus sp. Marseille-Q5471]